MKTVSIKMTWEGVAKEVAVGGEFNGWAPVPLFCQEGPFCQQGETWAVHLDVEPGCYTYRFLVDGSWKVKEGEGEEVEEDEKGEKANVLIVEEEDEEVEQQGTEEKEIIEEAAKQEVATIQDTLDTLTLENKQEIIDDQPEETKRSEILMEGASKEEQAEEKVEKKSEEEVEKKVDEEVEKKVEEEVDKKVEEEVEKKVEEKVEKKAELKAEIKETRSRKGKLTDKENTPKILKEAVLVKEGTPKNGTPVIKASKLGTPKLGTPKTGKLGKLHPDDIESPRRITRNLLAKLGPNASN